MGEASTSLEAVTVPLDLEEVEFRRQTSPDGMMTIVFTDVEASTKLMNRLGEERWFEVLHDHNNIVRRGVAHHRGQVVKFQGDGFMLAFASLTAALRCAVGLQRALSEYNGAHPEHPLRVRVGMHTGNVFQEGSDFFGKTVIRAARLTARARGGQVLVSAMCKEYAEPSGLWQFGPPRNLTLKGFDDVEQVYALAWSEPLLTGSR